MLAVTQNRLDITRVILKNPFFSLAIFQQVNNRHETAFTLARHPDIMPDIHTLLRLSEAALIRKENDHTTNPLSLIARFDTNVIKQTEQRFPETAHSSSPVNNTSSQSSIGPSASMHLSSSLDTSTHNTDSASQS